MTTYSDMRAQFERIDAARSAAREAEEQVERETDLYEAMVARYHGLAVGQTHNIKHNVYGNQEVTIAAFRIRPLDPNGMPDELWIRTREVMCDGSDLLPVRYFLKEEPEAAPEPPEEDT